MTDRELMQQALDVLIDGDIEWQERSTTRKVVLKIIAALRERLARQEQDERWIPCEAAPSCPCYDKQGTQISICFKNVEVRERLARQEPSADEVIASHAKRLALELECLLLECKDTAAVSKWWACAHEALAAYQDDVDRLYPKQDYVSPLGK